MTNIEAAEYILSLCEWGFEIESIQDLPSGQRWAVKEESVASINGIEAFRIPKQYFQSTPMAADFLARMWGMWAVDLAAQLQEILANPDKIARLYLLSQIFPIAAAGHCEKA